MQIRNTEIYLTYQNIIQMLFFPYTAKHLPTDDARNLSLTCKRIMNILPIYPPPLIIRGYNFEERQCEGILGQKWDGYFQPKRYFQSPLLESKIDQIQMTMKWKDQVLDHCWHEEVHLLWIMHPTTTFFVKPISRNFREFNFTKFS